MSRDEATGAFASNAVLRPGKVQGALVMDVFTPGVTVLHYFAARAPEYRLAWHFELDDPEPIPEPVETPLERYLELVEAFKAAGHNGAPPERIANQLEINRAITRNDQLRRVQWPWVWARAVLEQCPAAPAPDDQLPDAKGSGPRRVL